MRGSSSRPKTLRPSTRSYVPRAFRRSHSKETENMRRLLLLSLLLLVPAASASEQEKPAPKTFAQLTRGLQTLDGYFPLYYDAAEGKLLLEISRFEQEFLYQVSLPTGVGSNPLGLDRGPLGNSQVDRFE